MAQSVEIFVSYRLVNTLHKPNIWEDMAIDNIVSLCCRTCQTYEKIWPWTILCPFVVALMLCSSPCLLLKNMFMLLISMKRETKRKANKKQPSRKLRCDGNTIGLSRVHNNFRDKHMSPCVVVQCEFFQLL